MIIVLADDITGAAEIAGIALSEGRNTLLTMNRLPQNANGADVVVVATDIRSGDSSNAKKETERLCHEIHEMKINSKENIEIFKKTDSVLRGHISTELLSLTEGLGGKRSLLVAQNPSKGRVIRNGIYYVDDIPLDETMFRKDPEFPALSSKAYELVGKNCCRSLALGEEYADEADGIILIADAANIADIKGLAKNIHEKTLAAGGADFFREFLKQKYCSPTLSENGKEKDREDYDCVEIKGLNDIATAGKKILVVCGSTQSKSIVDTALMRKRHAIEQGIPDNIFEGADPKVWIDSVSDNYLNAQAYILRVGEHNVKGAEYARRIRNVMAMAAKEMTRKAMPHFLVIEGGATAFSVLERIGWTSFTVAREYAPGVVGMTHGKTEVILKPGSYPWGKLFD